MSQSAREGPATVAVLIGVLVGCSEPVAAPAAEPDDLAPSGSLAVSNVTTGAAFDPDGFLVNVAGNPPVRLELNQAAVVERLPAGAHTLELTGIAPNCSANAGTVRSVSVEDGSTARVHFDLVCTPPPELADVRIVFTQAVNEGGVHRARIVAMNADGSDALQLTSGAFHDQHPDVSMDGRRIAFQSDREGDPGSGSPQIFVMNADGSGLSSLTTVFGYQPDWSPDGSRIAFVGPPSHWGGPIMVLDVESGATGTLLTLDPRATVDMGAASPAWSPDGTRIAFGRGQLRAGGTYTGIFVMNADGTGESPVTDFTFWGGTSPVWSPDSRRIAFNDFEGPLGGPESGTGRIKVANVDGSGTRTVLQVPGNSLWAVNDWSPDGEFLLFGKGRDVYLLRVADGTMLRLTADALYDGGARFLPSPPVGAGGT